MIKTRTSFVNTCVCVCVCVCIYKEREGVCNTQGKLRKGIQKKNMFSFLKIVLRAKYGYLYIAYFFLLQIKEVVIL